MPKQPNILFFHIGASSFVKEDIHILKKLGNLKIFHFHVSHTPISFLKNLTQQVIWLLKNVKSADIIYCWFSDYHAVLPILIAKIFNLPSLTVLGGFDCNRFKNLNYGIFCSSWRAPLGKYVIKNTTLLLPVDETLISTNPISKNWGEAHPNGVSHNIRNFKTKWRALPTGYNSDSWQSGPVNRSRTVCTVALCSNHRTALIKGWDLFIETSKLLPDFEFIIVGASPSFTQELELKYKPQTNLKFFPPLKREHLESIYNQSSVYLQLSRAEGLPNVLCEAMMCGCVPVGSPVFGIPHGIGDSGYIAEEPEPEKISELVEISHQNADKLRSKARQQIVDNFSLQRREKSLREVFHELGVLEQ